MLVGGTPYEPPPPPPPGDIEADTVIALVSTGEPGELDFSGDIPDDNLVIGDSVSAQMYFVKLSVDIVDALRSTDSSSAFRFRRVLDVDRVGGLKIGSTVSAELSGWGQDQAPAADNLRTQDFVYATLVVQLDPVDITGDGILFGDSVSGIIRSPVPDPFARSGQAGGSGSVTDTNRPVSKQGQGAADHQLAPSTQGTDPGAEGREPDSSSVQGQGAADLS